MRLFASRAIEAPARRDVGLAAEDRREPELARGVVELHRAVHHAVIGQRDRRRSFFGGAPAEAVDPAGPVEKRVLGVDVQMDELTHGRSRTTGHSDVYRKRTRPATPRRRYVAAAKRVTRIEYAARAISFLPRTLLKKR